MGKKVLFYITIIMFVLGVCCLSLVPDNDLWARLIAGKHIVETFSVLKHDFLSYTPTHTWYDHEWGASIFLYSALKYFGGKGLIFLKGILAALSIIFCIKTVEINKPKDSKPYNILYFALMFWCVSNSIGTITRCLLFTCLFFSIFLYILELSRNGKNKYLFLLPVLMIIWCNFHGGCISAFGLISLYIIGEFLNKKPVKKYIYVLFACFAALFVNPYGINYVKFLFYAALMKRELIAEWNCSFLPQYTFMYLKYKFYLLFIILVEILYFIKLKINYKTLDKTKFLIVLVFAVLSVIKVRFQTFFVLSAGTLLYDEFYYIYNSFKESLKSKLLNNGKINNGYSEEKISNPVPDSDSSAQSQCSSALSEYLFGYSKVKEIIIYTLILLMSVYLIFIKNNEIRITESEYPRFAIEFIKINNIEGNLFINFNWGSYAAYKLYPDNLIVMDGRYEEVYNPILLNEMRDFHMLKGNWDKIIKDYKTDVMIIEKKYPVYEKIIENENWALIFENNLSGVFVPANKLQKEYKYPPANDNYYNSTMFLTDIEFK